MSAIAGDRRSDRGIGDIALGICGDCGERLVESAKRGIAIMKESLVGICACVY
jgi:hypothetical protein